MSGADDNAAGSVQFRGRYINKLDAKKRVSIPAVYRSALNHQPLVLRRSNRFRCIEAWPAIIFASTMTPITPSTVYTEEEDDDLYVNYADTVDATPDGEGRLVMDSGLLEFAGIADCIAILGKNRIFEFWEPRAADEQVERSRARSQARLMAARGANAA